MKLVSIWQWINMKEFRCTRIDQVISKNPDMIQTFNQAKLNTEGRYPSVRIDVDYDTMIYSVYSDESKSVIGFFTLDDFSGDEDIMRIQVLVHPLSCKLSYIKIFNCASYVLKHLDLKAKAFIIFSELPTLGLYGKVNAVFVEKYRLFNIYEHLPVAGSYIYSIPNEFKPSLRAYGDSAEYLTVRYQ